MEPQPRATRPSTGRTAAPIVVMGVSGSGKSTVGSALAQRLRVPFVDADTLHPPANIAKMAAGEPLDDDDRYPWLEKVGRVAGRPPRRRSGGSCSALKRKYRDQLRAHCPRRRVPAPARFTRTRSAADWPPGQVISCRPHCCGRNSTLGTAWCRRARVSPSHRPDVDAIIDTFLADSAAGRHPGS